MFNQNERTNARIREHKFIRSSSALNVAMKRAALIAAAVLTAIAFSPSNAEAGEKTTCKVATNDIGTIVGRGANKDTAFEDAATQCFDRRAKLYQMRKGASVDEDSGLVMIDMCANIKCS